MNNLQVNLMMKECSTKILHSFFVRHKVIFFLKIVLYNTKEKEGDYYGK